MSAILLILQLAAAVAPMTDRHQQVANWTVEDVKRAEDSSRQVDMTRSIDGVAVTYKLSEYGSPSITISSVKCALAGWEVSNQLPDEPSAAQVEEAKQTAADALKQLIGDCPDEAPAANAVMAGFGEAYAILAGWAEADHAALQQ